MKATTEAADWKGYLRGVNIPLLLFFIGVLDVKLYIKVAVIGLAFLAHRKRGGNPNEGGWKKRPRYLWFYLAMPLLALVNLPLSAAVPGAGLLAFALGCLFWVLSLLAAYHIYRFVQEDSPERLHRTISLLFLLNGTCMIASFVVICIQAGTINPYTFEGFHRKYFINTGDMIRGLGFDGSVPAALLSACGVFYFLYRDKRAAALLCMIALLLAGSNWINLQLAAIFLFIFFFHTNQVQKGQILLYGVMIAAFWLAVSPQNADYVKKVVQRVDGKHAYIPPVPIPNAKNYEFVESKAVEQREEGLAGFLAAHYTKHQIDSIESVYRGWHSSGRFVSLQMLMTFFKDHPSRLPLGTGMGNFSSRLAFKTAALDIFGTYPLKDRYIDPFFRDHYLYLYLHYHARDEGQHSVVNKPDSVYGQLLGEYGLIGLLLFVILYVGFFTKNIRLLTYGLPLLLLMGMAFITEYWVEQLSVVILFEFLLLLDNLPITPNLTPNHEP